MAEVRFERTLNAPAALVFEALGELLTGIAEQSGPWNGFAFHVALAEMRLPDVGYVAIPIALSLAATDAPVWRYEIVVSASRHPESFPVFRGTLRVDAAGTSSSRLWMTGTYEVPLHFLGAVVNATLVQGVARRTLENFLTDLVTGCHARIEERQSDLMRYVLFRHGTP